MNYADGSGETVPVYGELDVDNYVQRQPTAVSGAQAAWSRADEGTDQWTVAYSMQWNNPHPDKEIATIALAYGPDNPGGKRGVPALLAVSAATAPEADDRSGECAASIR